MFSSWRVSLNTMTHYYDSLKESWQEQVSVGFRPLPVRSSSKPSSHEPFRAFLGWGRRHFVKADIPRLGAAFGSANFPQQEQRRVHLSATHTALRGFEWWPSQISGNDQSSSGGDLSPVQHEASSGNTRETESRNAHPTHTPRQHVYF